MCWDCECAQGSLLSPLCGITVALREHGMQRICVAFSDDAVDSGSIVLQHSSRFAAGSSGWEINVCVGAVILMLVVINPLGVFFDDAPLSNGGVAGGSQVSRPAVASVSLLSCWMVACLAFVRHGVCGAPSMLVQVSSLLLVRYKPSSQHLQ